MNIILLAMIVWGVGLSASMAFFPKKVLDYVASNRMWRWYFKAVFGYTPEKLRSAGFVLRAQVHGRITLFFTAIIFLISFRQLTGF
ncbi:hypothetical protein [Pseudomonas sp. 3A(2025)]